MAGTTITQPIAECPNNDDLPIGHYAHPFDPSKRTALCGVEILGIPTFGEFVLCEDCLWLRAAHDWAALPNGRAVVQRTG